MTVFWNSKKAMPQADVIKKAEENGIRNWKERSIFSIINNLLAKGLVAHTLNDKELVVFKRALKAEVNAADAETASGVEEATESAPAEEA